jgi:hypothetical protein
MSDAMTGWPVLALAADHWDQALGPPEDFPGMPQARRCNVGKAYRTLIFDRYIPHQHTTTAQPGVCFLSASIRTVVFSSCGGNCFGTVSRDVSTRTPLTGLGRPTEDGLANDSASFGNKISLSYDTAAQRLNGNAYRVSAAGRRIPLAESTSAAEDPAACCKSMMIDHMSDAHRATTLASSATCIHKLYLLPVASHRMMGRPGGLLVIPSTGNRTAIIAEARLDHSRAALRYAAGEKLADCWALGCRVTPSVESSQKIEQSRYGKSHSFT